MVSSIISILIIAGVLIVGWFIFKSILKFIMFFITVLLIVVVIFGILAYMDYKTLSSVYDDSEKLVLLESEGDIQVGFKTTELWLNENVVREMVAESGDIDFEFIAREKLVDYSYTLQEGGKVDYEGTVLVFDVDELKVLDFPSESITGALEEHIDSKQVDIFMDYMAVGWITQEIMVTEFIDEINSGNIIMVPGLNILKISKKLPKQITDRIKGD